MLSRTTVPYFDVVLVKYKVLRVQASSIMSAQMMAENQLNKDTTEYWEATDAVLSENQQEG